MKSCPLAGQTSFHEEGLEVGNVWLFVHQDCL